MNENFTDRKYRDIALTAAKQLGYGNAVIEKIKAAKDDTEIERIMVTARKKNFDKDV